MAAVILGACRTPIGSFGGALKDVGVADLGAIAVREALIRARCAPSDLGDVVLGCVLQGGQGMNVARQAAIKAGVSHHVPAMTINRVCGSGLQAVVTASQAIAAGDYAVAIAGGMESMSNAAYVLRGARWGYRMGHAEVTDAMIHDGLTDAMHSCHMGVTAEEIASRYAITRADQDAFAAESQRRAVSAIASGAFAAEIVPVVLPQKKGDPVVFAIDEYPRAGTTAEKLGGLRAAFRKDGSVTAGNASGINDGAAALVVASDKYAGRTGAPVLARIVSSSVAGVEPMVMGMGPVPAARTALARAGLGIADIDLFELNEAFAVQSLAVARELDIDPARVNVNGGAIALGHPIGASGARILVTLVHALQARNLRRGLAALCIGGGMGIAVVVERG